MQYDADYVVRSGHKKERPVAGRSYGPVAGHRPLRAAGALSLHKIQHLFAASQRRVRADRGAADRTAGVRESKRGSMGRLSQEF